MSVVGDAHEHPERKNSNKKFFEKTRWAAWAEGDNLNLEPHSATPSPSFAVISVVLETMTSTET